MSKFQEDHYYFIYEELSKNEELKNLFNETLTTIKGKEKYRYYTAYEQCEVSFNKAKKLLIKDC